MNRTEFSRHSVDALTDGERRLQSLIHGSDEPVSTLERQWALTRLGIPETTIPHDREATRAAVSTVQLLGMRWVRLVSLSLSTIANTKNLIETINWSCLWMHSYACGRLTNAIAANLGLAASDSLHAAGLFHDIGKIILSYLYPQEYRQALLTAFNQRASLCSIEKLIFDMTHEEAGAFFARQSNLPPDLNAALHFHSNPGLAEGVALEVCALVNLANHISKHHGLGYSGNPFDASISTDELPGWQLLAENHHTMPASPEILEEALVPIVRDVKEELKSINR